MTNDFTLILPTEASVGALRYEFEKSVTQTKISIMHNAKNNAMFFEQNWPIMQKITQKIRLKTVVFMVFLQKNTEICFVNHYFVFHTRASVYNWRFVWDTIHNYTWWRLDRKNVNKNSRVQQKWVHIFSIPKKTVESALWTSKTALCSRKSHNITQLITHNA